MLMVVAQFLYGEGERLLGDVGRVWGALFSAARRRSAGRSERSSCECGTGCGARVWSGGVVRRRATALRRAECAVVMRSRVCGSGGVVRCDGAAAGPSVNRV